MRLLMKAAILSMCCSSLIACDTVREAAPLRPDLDNPDRLVCEGLDLDSEGRVVRPARPEPYVIDWDKVETVEQARLEHGRFVAVENVRNGVVATYLVKVEGDLFVCSNNIQWWRDYYGRLPAPAE